MNNVMVINMGLKSIRCIIFNQNGLKLGSAAIAINTAINDKRVEQDPAEWWEKAEIVMRKALKDAGNVKIEYITVTTSASCLVCVDSNGNPLGKAFMVSDKRAEKEVQMISEMKEFEEVKKNTGLDMSVSLMLPKILWVKRNLPEMFEKTRYFMTPNDYLIYKLCGECVTDYLNATKYHYDLAKKMYPEVFLKKLGISVNKLPEVTDTGVCIGKINRNTAEKINSNQDIKVVVTSYDAICSFIGSGVSEEGEASDVSGTVTVFRALSKKKGLVNSNKIYNVPFYQEDANIVGGSNNLGGGLIEWVKQCYYQGEQYPYEIMEKDANESEIGAKGLIFLPYLLGERTPVWDNNARGVFFGLERMHTRKDMTRAVFESTGFIDLDIIDAIKETGVDIESVRLSGGLARINLISQIKADVLGRDVMVLAEFETTASGAAMMVLAGQGVYQNMKEAANKFALIRMIIKPNLENHRKYIYMYELYKETYNSLKDLYVRRIEILDKIRNDREVRIENL
ncbi:MAG: hypothetical protein IKW30_12795 [Lachnospiraceae bacterium]|nr:hypothetical protein [Lachnospiraceae bacterium]